MSFPPEKRTHVGSWKPCPRVHGQKDTLLPLLEETGAGGLGSSNCFGHHHEGLREVGSFLMGTVNAVLREEASQSSALCLRGPGTDTGPALSELPSELERETYVMVGQRRGPLPFLSICKPRAGWSLGWEIRREGIALKCEMMG